MKIADEIKKCLKEVKPTNPRSVNFYLKEILKLIDKENEAMRRIREGE